MCMNEIIKNETGMVVKNQFTNIEEQISIFLEETKIGEFNYTELPISR